MSPTARRSSGAAAIVLRGSSSNTPRHHLLRTPAASSAPRRSRTPTSPRAWTSRTCPPGSASRIACCFRISPICACSALRSKGAFGRPRDRARALPDPPAIATSRSPFPATASGKAGESMPRAAAYGCTTRCAACSRTSSSTSATRSTRTSRSRQRWSWTTGRPGGMSSPSRSRRSRRRWTITAGAHRYNLLDEHMRRFNAEVSQIALWDDHEVRDNWYPTQRLDGDARYQVKSVALLAARAKRAFLDYLPLRVNPIERERIYRSWRHGPSLEIFALDMRSYRGANSSNRQAVLNEDSAILGAAQVEWLQRALAASTSTWKVVASDLPLGVVVPDAGGAFEAVANQDDGPPLGRELEIARVLTFIRDRRIRNVVWLTADVHYCAAHHYSPARARFTEFDPFWEFVSGPLHAGTFGPSALDRTFGPEVRFLGIPRGMKPNRPPSEPYQFFGSGRIDRRTQALTMKLHNVNGEIFSVELPPAK